MVDKPRRVRLGLVLTNAPWAVSLHIQFPRQRLGDSTMPFDSTNKKQGEQYPKTLKVHVGT
jgi:hypothetical protein